VQKKSNILKIAFQKLHDVRVKSVNIICDGLSANLSMLRKLGICLDLNSFQRWFPHPRDPSQKMTVMLHACHLLKLARNTLSDFRVLKDAE
jgi:hypothetical protein